MTNHGLTVARSCPKPGGNPIEDNDEDEVERLVEVNPELVEAYMQAQVNYKAAYDKAEELKLVRDVTKSLLVEKLDYETGTATVGGTRLLSVRVTSSNRIDTTRLRREAPDIARMYEKESVSSRVDVI